jgi:glycosyltransferase involved in cell wall biosynthesis
VVKDKQLDKSFSISVFFPCYNDAGSISLLVKNADVLLKNITSNYEIIVVDDCSKDESRHVLELLKKEVRKLKLVFHKKNLGYGGALKSGFKASHKKWVFYTDGDGQYDVGDLTKLIEKVEKGVDVVQGYKINRSDPWYRIFVGKAYHYFTKLLFNLKIRDVDCDFRLIKKSALDSIQLTYNSGVICVELVKKLQNNNCKSIEVGIHHYPRFYGHSQFFNYKRIAKTLFELGDLWFNLVIFKDEKRI